MGRTVLVTGGIAGIGAAAARLFKAAGHTVIANYRSDDTSAAAFAAATAIAVRKWNVADFAACQTRVAGINESFGPVEILINNAGITHDATLHKMTPEQWQSVIDVDLTGVFNMSRSVIEIMRSRNFGRIINVSSVNAQSGQYGQTNYAAAKAGVIGFTKALALESAAHGITVNAIAPGIRRGREPAGHQAAGTAGRSRRRPVVSHQRRRGLHDRPNAQRGWRTGAVVANE